MKLIWTFDDNKHLVGNGKEVADDYQLEPNETDIWPPEMALAPITFCGDHWEGVSPEEWLANQPEPEPVGPTEQDLINAQLLQQSAAQQMTNAEIIKEIATIKGGN